MIFPARRSCASVVLGAIILSVCLSVDPCNTCKQCSVYSLCCLITQTSAQYSLLQSCSQFSMDTSNCVCVCAFNDSQIYNNYRSFQPAVSYVLPQFIEEVQCNLTAKHADKFKIGCKLRSLLIDGVYNDLTANGILYDIWLFNLRIT